jgi:hypothetical protein
MSLLWKIAKDAATTDEVRAEFEPVTKAMYADHGHGLVQLDDSYRDGPVDLHSPSCGGTCDQVSERAQGHAHGLVHPPPGRMRMSRPHPDYMIREDHVVLVHKNHVVDYTLRQFEPHAEVPHVQPIKDYMRERGFDRAERD